MIEGLVQDINFHYYSTVKFVEVKMENPEAY